MNDTDTAFEELETILAKEYEAHEKMLSAATEVNVAIKKNDLATLQKNTSNLDEQVFQIEQIEEKRLACCSRLSLSIGTGSEPVRLAAIIEKAPPLFREKLGQLQTALKNAIAKIAQITIANRILIEEGLTMVQGQFAIIMQSGMRFAHYEHKGGRATAALPYNPLFNRTI
jgi:hypothetical protein